LRRLRDRDIKRKLVEQLRKSGRVRLEEIIEWLWEDFGIRSKFSWRDVERNIVKHDEITPNDLAVFMIEKGVMPREEIWLE
jgi:hypothetical protein